VQFPTGGMLAVHGTVSKPASLRSMRYWLHDRFGAKPKPTVQSGWEKVYMRITVTCFLLGETGVSLYTKQTL